MLCDERAIEKYDTITLTELMQYENRTPEMQDYLDRICGSAASGNPRLMNYRTALGNTGLQTFNLPTSKRKV